ncbi:hypothetical protein CAPTEDRAFT_228646 [Capitella teleta]|uniref:Large ribosomal subunit protein bL32m n=1 Tax=Capitella teleta TaxID=283909 RepID=R7V4J3_CAPTE|nr:hypothetical protein CAPTEDRAFT_228646 [Capitella teleta]|eukprot:ELU13494.1 hypothetical protein CAPTEDRAFT_228646 [Capitella teleta]
MTNLATKCRNVIRLLHRHCAAINESLFSKSNGLHPALALDVAAPPSFKQQPSKPFSLNDLFADNIFWAAVPKKRRSYAKKWTRRFGPDKIRKFMTPRINLVSCLECGTWHERHSICGSCYEKVREETKAMQSSMNPEEFHYNHPRSEVAYVFHGEDANDHPDKYIVEVDKPRPDWWPKHMLTKGHGKYS